MALHLGMFRERVSPAFCQHRAFSVLKIGEAHDVRGMCCEVESSRVLAENFPAKLPRD